MVGKRNSRSVPRGFRPSLSSVQKVTWTEGLMLRGWFHSMALRELKSENNEENERNFYVRQCVGRCSPGCE